MRGHTDEYNTRRKSKVSQGTNSNDLKSMLMTIHECGGLWVSDVRKLESLEHLLHEGIMKFVPLLDDEGRPKYYVDYVPEEVEDDR